MFDKKSRLRRELQAAHQKLSPGQRQVILDAVTGSGPNPQVLAMMQRAGVTTEDVREVVLEIFGPKLA